jgi:hypothetical protein
MFGYLEGVERSDLPDCYAPWGEMGMVLVDPVWCPAGHPIEQLTRGGVTHCSDPEHQPHLTWRCACGQPIYRIPGVYVGELECLPKATPR